MKRLVTHWILLAAISLAQVAVAAPLVDDRHLTVQSPTDVAQSREKLIQFIWGTGHLPVTMPGQVKRDAPSPVKETNHLLRVDALEITMEAGQRAVAYHFIPHHANGTLVIVHQGHGCSLDSLGVGDLIRDLLGAGCAALGMYMPRCRPDDCPGSCTAQHETLFATNHPAAGSPMKFFLEPIVASLNYLQARHREDAFPPYTAFHMAGLSGGGWTTTVYAAVDPRITLSFPVAGTIPLYLRSGGSVGDVEQTLPEFYRLAGYPDLYLLGSYGPGRRQIQILNRRDDCCFGMAQHSGPVPYDDSMRAYEQQLQAQLQRLGSGAFRLEIDETAPSHLISHHAATNLILREIKSSQPNRPLTVAPQ